jgi:hypothetical protein
MTAAAPANAAPKMRGATRLLRDILDSLEPAAPAEPTATLGEVVDRFDERAFGFALLLLALPCCLPFVYVLPQILALPMAAIAVQLALGKRHPWLPGKLRARRFSIPALRHVVARSEKYVGWVERLARPRLKPVTGRLGLQCVGVILLAPIASILTPLPWTNTVPGIGVAVVALGLIERDGLLVVGGLVIGFFWVFMLVFFGVEAVTFVTGWISARF